MISSMIPSLFCLSVVLICGHHVADAHMGVTPSIAAADVRTVVSVRIGHDCGDETVGTTNFTVVLPKYMSSVKVEQMAHWRVFIHKVNGTVGEKKKYYKHLLSQHAAGTPEPIEEDEDEMEASPDPADMEPVEYVSAVTYIGFLPDYFYQLFNLRIHMPDLSGAKLWFKGYQDCHNQGTSIAWATIPSEEDPRPRYPARSITLVSSELEAHHMLEHEMMEGH